ncbi:MAG TPA: hypothetical protein VHG31_02685 [Stellaceae bacterium]|nr:hypothetical protein [Stellaceae bacterium]
MTADTIGAGGSAAGPDPGEPRDMTAGGVVASVALHVIVAALVVFGVPNLFRKPPPQDMPIAVQLVTIAAETRATHPNPFRPHPEAKPEPPLAQPAPIPEPKPEPPAPSPAPPPSAAATQAPPPPPRPEAKPVTPVPPPAAKAEAKPLPPPKPVEARTRVVPPPLPERKPKPSPERRPVQHASAESKPKPQPTPRPEPKAEAKPDTKKVDPTAFSKLLQDLETPEKPEKKEQPDAFDSLLTNLTKQQTTRTEDPTPAPKRMAALSPPSAQPKAPLGTELTASELDIVRQQLSRCWNIPAGARDARDLVVTIRGSIAPDGRVLQATIVDQARLGDPFFRAAAESARRAFFHPLCTPLRLPPEKYESWKTFEIALSPKDIL